MNEHYARSPVQLRQPPPGDDDDDDERALCSFVRLSTLHRPHHCYPPTPPTSGSALSLCPMTNEHCLCVAWLESPSCYGDDDDDDGSFIYQRVAAPDG